QRTRSRSFWNPLQYGLASNVGLPPCKRHKNAKGFFMLPVVSNPRRAALMVALFADALQIVFFPLFAEGALSPVNDLLDIAVAWVLTRLLCWHWAVLPSLLAEFLPGVDLVPSWTIAVLLVTCDMPTEDSTTHPPVIE